VVNDFGTDEGFGSLFLSLISADFLSFLDTSSDERREKKRKKWCCASKPTFPRKIGLFFPFNKARIHRH